MNAAAANASAKAAAARAEEAMENVQVQVTQVLKQTKPEVPLGSPAKEVQPEAQLEPTAKENIPAAAVDMAALIAALQTMQHDMQLSPGASGFPSFPQVTEEEREKGKTQAIPSEVMTRSRRREQRPRNWQTRLRRK